VPGFGFVRFHQYWEGVPCCGSTRFAQYWEGVPCCGVTKREERELERELCKNTKTTRHSELTDPNRI
jgi:hypothetical protein